MGISEKKMEIVIDNYFKQECNVNTSIREAFEKGFRIGVKKGASVKQERIKSKWVKHNMPNGTYYYDCFTCGCVAPFTETADSFLWKLSNFCPDCGCRMEG